MSHLLTEHRFDFIGIQETKSSGNTLTQLASGFLINSSNTALHNQDETRGTGLVFRKYLAPCLRKLYQGNSRWCGALFLAKPVPILVLSVYAPTAAADPETKLQFYQEIGDIPRENGSAMIIILGDFNARILANPGLPRHIGTNIFQSDRPLRDQAEDVLESRDLFLDFLIQNDLVALNTIVPKPPSEQITFRHPGQPDFAPPWVENNFAQIDYILTKGRFRNMFAEGKTHPHLNYDSDHLPVGAIMTVHWYFGSPKKVTPPKRHLRKCTPEAKGAYNEELRKKPWTWETIRQDITELSQSIRGTQPPNVKKPYLKNTSIERLRQRDAALQEGNAEESKRLTAQSRRQVKKDRKEHTTEKLRAFVGAQQNWPAIKDLRKPFIPRFSKRGNTKAAIPSQYPNDCARYFATEHWKTPLRQAPPDLPFKSGRGTFHNRGTQPRNRHPPPQ